MGKRDKLKGRLIFAIVGSLIIVGISFAVFKAIEIDTLAAEARKAEALSKSRLKLITIYNHNKEIIHQKCHKPSEWSYRYLSIETRGLGGETVLAVGLHSTEQKYYFKNWSHYTVEECK